MRADSIAISASAMARRVSARPSRQCTIPTASGLKLPAASRLGAEAAWAVNTVSTTVFYTPEVVNSPRRIEQDLRTKRHQLRMLAVEVWLQDQRFQYQAQKEEEALLPPKRIESATKQNGKVVQIYASAAAPRRHSVPLMPGNVRPCRIPPT